jgi:hypothetical protein
MVISALLRVTDHPSSFAMGGAALAVVRNGRLVSACRLIADHAGLRDPLQPAANVRGSARHQTDEGASRCRPT